MFFKPHKITLFNFLLYVFPCIFTFSFLFNLGLQSNVSALTPPPASQVVQSFVPEFQIYGRLCGRSNNSTYGEKYTSCNNSQWLTFESYGTDTIDGITYYRMRYPIPSYMKGGSLYFITNRLKLNTASSDDVADNSYIWSFINSDYTIYTGNARFFYSENNGLRYDVYMGGLNPYITGSYWNDYYSCLDNNPDCQFRYSWDTTTGTGSTFITSLNYKKPSSWPSNIGFSGINVMNNYYDTTDEQFNWMFNDEYVPLYMLNTGQYPSSADAYIYFTVAIVETSELYNLTDSDGVDPDSVLGVWEDEKYLINENTDNANGSNNSLLGLNIANIALPFSNWFDLFTDQRCTTISVIPGWFGLSSQYICSPWPYTITSVLTPIMSVMSIMLLFGFIIHFMRGGGTPGDDIAYGHGKYKGVH